MSGTYYPSRNYAVGQLIATLRGRTQLTQAQLATRLAVSRRSVQKWESGEALPTARHLREFIALLAEAKAPLPGRERAEAAELWRAVSANAAQALPELEQAWRDGVLPRPAAHEVVLDADSRADPPRLAPLGIIARPNLRRSKSC